MSPSVGSRLHGRVCLVRVTEADYDFVMFRQCSSLASQCQWSLGSLRAPVPRRFRSAGLQWTRDPSLLMSSGGCWLLRCTWIRRVWAGVPIFWGTEPFEELRKLWTLRKVSLPPPQPHPILPHHLLFQGCINLLKPTECLQFFFFFNLLEHLQFWFRRGW